MEEVIKKQFVGRFGTIETPDGLEVDIMVKDVKKDFGQLYFLITPTQGRREVWKKSTNVILEPK